MCGEYKSISGTFLGFDYGVKKIGVAVGQTITGTASPLETILSVRQKTNWQSIAQLIKTWQPNGFVVGICYQQDGEENPVTPLIFRFARQLRGRFNLPVYLFDETLTTREAKNLLADDLRLRADKLWKVQDQVAAQLIVQSWMTASDQQKTRISVEQNVSAAKLNG